MTTKWVFLDFDNTLMDTERLTLPSLIKRFNDLYQLNMTAAEFSKNFHGGAYRALCDAVSHHYGITVDYDAVFHDREWSMMEVCRNNGVVMADGLLDAFSTLAARDVRFAVATNNTIQRVLAAIRYATNKRSDELMAHLGTRFFQAPDALKPRPDVYIRAMLQCGANPNHSAAVEDSVTGVIAAHAAGLKTYGYTGFFEGDKNAQSKKLREAGAVACFDDWRNFPVLLDA